MDIKKTLKEALNGMLDDQSIEDIAGAVEARIASVNDDVRAELEESIRAEYANRYDSDKGLLIEAMDRMLTDAIKAELTEFAQDRNEVRAQRAQLVKETKKVKSEYRRKLAEHKAILDKFITEKLTEELKEFTDDRKAISEQRIKLAKSLVESKTSAKKELNEKIAMLEKFVLRQLHEEMTEFAQDRRLLQEQRRRMVKELREDKIRLRKQFAERTNMLESFVLNQLSSELKEFNEDKKALVESRVKLLAEGKKKINETQRVFIERAAPKVEKIIETAIKNEMTQFRNDIKAARENNFGRRIFEAFVGEYMTSSFSDGTRMKDLIKQMEQSKAKLDEMSKKVANQERLLKEAQSKLSAAEDTTTRVKIMNELMSPLSRDKKAIMSEMLENVATSKLRETYNRYLPTILNEDRKAAAPAKRRIVENRREQHHSVKSGDRTNRLAESAKAETTETVEVSSELNNLVKLAGIKQ